MHEYNIYILNAVDDEFIIIVHKNIAKYAAFINCDKTVTKY